MKLTVEYTFTPQLTAQIYVERAERRAAAKITVQDTQLPPGARADALVALAVVQQYHYSYRTLEISPDVAAVDRRPAAEADTIWLDWPDPVSTEPTVEDAVRDAATALRLAAEAAPRVRAELERRKLEAEAESARKRADAIEALLAKPLGVWLIGDPPHRRLESYRDRAGLPSATSALIELDPRLARRAEEAEEAALRENEAHLVLEVERANAVKAWIAEHAPELAARHGEGLLPETELLERVRASVFAPLDFDFKRHEKITAADIEHGECEDSEPKFSAVKAEELTGEEFECFTAIREAASEMPQVTSVWPREHRGWCGRDNCDGGTTSRRSALVTVEWCGRRLSREYAL
jgi:hypothetical protein